MRMGSELPQVVLDGFKSLIYADVAAIIMSRDSSLMNETE